WIQCLIVKVFGRSVGYHYMLTKIHQIWHPRGKISMVDLGLDFYLAKFSFQDDFSFVLSGGSCFIGRNFLTFRHWEPEFRPSIAPVTMTIVWLRLVELPLEFFKSDILSRIGNELGTLLRIDPHTIEGARGRFSRLCIQIDVNKPLVSRIRIGRYVLSVQYEGIDTICFRCGCIGHKTESCPLLVKGIK
ncbi:DUF4283 domain-containing protein/zf-CCHC_4 domain-containing protein, partial [Cephalotus follicularis]